MNKNIDFVNGNTKKCLLEMTVPMIIAMFLNMAYNLVDSLWIGNLLGEQAYAALTNSTPIILILTSIGMGATNGLAILLSQVIGAKNEQKKKNIIGKPTKSMILMIFYYIIIRIPFAYLLSWLAENLNGVWIAILISHIVACIITILTSNQIIKRLYGKLYDRTKKARYKSIESNCCGKF